MLHQYLFWHQHKAINNYSPLPSFDLTSPGFELQQILASQVTRNSDIKFTHSAVNNTNTTSRLSLICASKQGRLANQLPSNFNSAYTGLKVEESGQIASLKLLKLPPPNLLAARKTQTIQLNFLVSNYGKIKSNTFLQILLSKSEFKGQRIAAKTLLPLHRRCSNPSCMHQDGDEIKLKPLISTQ